MNPRPLLSIEGLRIELDAGPRTANVVDGVDLRVDAGSTVGLVGESGCGKSLTALAILRLLPRPAARVAGGRIVFEDRDLLELPATELRRVRGARIAMVFQEPMTSLNPVISCGEQIAEVLRTHLGLDRRAAGERAVELLDTVRIERPAERARQLPHELSGGMRQRVMIAMAIAAGPRLLLADEPTTALDVTVQRRILDRLDELRAELGMAILLVTHDLAILAGRSERVAVMYAGRVVEDAPTDQLFAGPAHPYTLGLLACRPSLAARRERLASIPGRVPDPFARPAGCAFHPRCPFATERCAQEVPPPVEVGPAHWSACFETERVREQGRWPR